MYVASWRTMNRVQTSATQLGNKCPQERYVLIKEQSRNTGQRVSHFKTKFYFCLCLLWHQLTLLSASFLLFYLFATFLYTQSLLLLFELHCQGCHIIFFRFCVDLWVFAGGILPFVCSVMMAVSGHTITTSSLFSVNSASRLCHAHSRNIKHTTFCAS